MKTLFHRIGPPLCILFLLILVRLLGTIGGIRGPERRPAAPGNDEAQFPRAIYRLAISDDGGTIAAIRQYRRIDLFDSRTLQRIDSIEIADDMLADIDFGSGDREILATCHSGRVELWRREGAGWISKRLTTHPAGTVRCARAQGGTVAATADWAGNIVLWDLKRSTRIGRLRESTSVRRLCFFPDGRRLLSGTTDGTVTIWDTKTRTPLLRLNAGPISIWSIAASPGGRFVLTGNVDGLVTLWNAATAEKIWEKQLDPRPMSAPICAVAFSASNRGIAVAAVKSRIFVFDIRTGALRRPPLTSTRGHVSDLRFSPDGTKLYASDHNGSLRVWNAAQF